MGCDKDATSSALVCGACPEPNSTGAVTCAFYTGDVSCFEDCGLDTANLTPEETAALEDFTEVCTACLVDDDCDDALNGYSDCTACKESCEDELLSEEYCNDYCDFLYCGITCDDDPSNIFCSDG